MSTASRAPVDPEVRARLKLWLADWARAAPVLEAERWDRLRTMTVSEAQEATRRVLELWQPDWHGDDGEALLLVQRVIARATRLRP